MRINLKEQNGFGICQKAIWQALHPICHRQIHGRQIDHSDVATAFWTIF